MFFALSSLCCMIYPEVNTKQATTALMFSLSGLVSSYIKVYQTRNAKSAAPDR